MKDKTPMHKNLNTFLLQLQLTESVGYSGPSLKEIESKIWAFYIPPIPRSVCSSTY